VEFRLDDDNVLWHDTRLCVPNDDTLKEAMLIEAHSSPFSVHPGSTKMYHDLKQRHDAIWVVVDRLTKSAHFLPIRKDYSVSRLAETFQQEIRAWGTRLKFSTAFHPQTDGQSERTIQTLEDMLRPKMIEVTNEKVAVANEKLKEARTRQKSYADKHRKSLEFQPGDHVFLKVSPARGVRRFGIKGKLSPRFIAPFEILNRVGKVSYHLTLPPQLSHVHNVFHVSFLRGYKYHPLHVISYPLDQICADLFYVEETEAILDRQDRVMRKKTIPFVKI
nr:hypothetical protein [Tanacetum cinerariifolium]